MKNQLKPNKNAKVPRYDYITEGYDPAKCDELNRIAQEKYQKELDKRKRKG